MVLTENICVVCVCVCVCIHIHHIYIVCITTISIYVGEKMLFVPYPLFYIYNYLFLLHGLREDFLEEGK